MSEDCESLLQKSYLKKNHLSLVEMPRPSSEDFERPPPLTFAASKGVSALIHKRELSPGHYFTAEVRKRSPYDFVMVAHDSFHFLYCELPLKVEKNEEGLFLVCQFPTICDEELIDFVEEDETLLGMALIQFHMQILKSLFLLSTAQNAQKLIIKIPEDQFNGLGIYKDFIKHIDKIPTQKGMSMEITLPARINACSESIEDITEQFRRTLWQDYSSNPAIRNYLAANVRFSVVV